jgi:hypothetical protein
MNSIYLRFMGTQNWYLQLKRTVWTSVSELALILIIAPWSDECGPSCLWRMRRTRWRRVWSHPHTVGCLADMWLPANAALRQKAVSAGSRDHQKWSLRDCFRVTPRGEVPWITEVMALQVCFCYCPRLATMVFWYTFHSDQTTFPCRKLPVLSFTWIEYL